MIPKLDDVSVLEVGIDNPISNDMLKCWNKYKNRSMNRIGISTTSTFKGIQSSNALNLPNFQEDHLFQERLDNLLSITESIIGERLTYHWVHFVEYYRGGYQEIHNHKHNEDYSFILYLNTCRGGQTYFDIKPPVSFSPKKNNMLLFKSDIDHGAHKTSSWFRTKKILVCGLRKLQ